MTFSIDDSSATPPFEQVKQQLIGQIRDGELQTGAKLPTVRHLADELGLATNTVARAYRELERADIIETRGRNGSFVAVTGDANHKQAQVAAAAFVQRVHLLGVDVDAAVDLVRSAFDAAGE